MQGMISAQNPIPDKNGGVIQVQCQFFSEREYMQLLIYRSDRRAVESISYTSTSGLRIPLTERAALRRNGISTRTYRLCRLEESWIQHNRWCVLSNFKCVSDEEYLI